VEQAIECRPHWVADEGRQVEAALMDRLLLQRSKVGVRGTNHRAEAGGFPELE
jgi:hypothetical protein